MVEIMVAVVVVWIMVTVVMVMLGLLELSGVLVGHSHQQTLEMSNK
jgi:energy-converting hydrogenase Eha subunit B